MNNNAPENAPEKKKKLFTVQSPYADYAADNDSVSEAMNGGEEPVKPTKEQIISSALTAVGLVVIFVLIALFFSWSSSCILK